MTPASTAELIATRALELDGELRPEILETPVVRWPSIAQDGRSVFLKLESEQVTGSFKARGALAKARQAYREGGSHAIAASTGNHGLAVTHAVRDLGLDVTVYVPETASAAKVASIEALGATIRRIVGDPIEAELAARAAAVEGGSFYVSPYNDQEVVAGQGTIAVELDRQLDPVEAVYVAVGGGGLISGIASVVRRAWPGCAIVGAYPARSPAMAASVAAGRIVKAPSHPTLSDATAGAVEPGAITFELCSELVDRWVAVSETDIARMMGRLLEEEEIVVEGAAAVALHAAATGSETTAVAIICGGNVDPAGAGLPCSEVDRVGVDADRIASIPPHLHDGSQTDPGQT